MPFLVPLLFFCGGCSALIYEIVWFQDMRMQRMLGDLPALLHGRPEKVLVVGFGAGVTAGSFVPHPGVRRILICEIEPLIPAAVAPYFVRENRDVVHDRRTELVYDDARHHVLTTPERFDVITSDPIHPWIKGTAVDSRELSPRGSHDL